MLEFLKKHKTKIIITVAVVAVLTAAFFLGENSAPNENENSVVSAEISEKASTDEIENKTSSEEVSKENSKAESSENIIKESSIEESLTVSNNQESSIANSEISQQSQISNTVSETEESHIVSESESTGQNSIPESSVTETEESKEISDEKDELTCTISISCATILNNMDKLDNSKKELIPSDGCILQEISVEYSEGESAFDVLKRTCTERKIHLEFSKTPIYNSVYIEGINNIYEFDCGSMSGWMYCVNGNYYNYSCSEYIVNDGDEIEFLYTCDLGKDIGKENF